MAHHFVAAASLAERRQKRETDRWPSYQWNQRESKTERHLADGKQKNCVLPLIAVLHCGTLPNPAFTATNSHPRVWGERRNVRYSVLVSETHDLC
jgi:hypothetical protein